MSYEKCAISCHVIMEHYRKRWSLCTHVGSPNKIGRIAAGSQSCSSIPSPQILSQVTAWECVCLCVLYTYNGLVCFCTLTLQFLSSKKPKNMRPRNQRKTTNINKPKRTRLHTGELDPIRFLFSIFVVSFFVIVCCFFWVSWLFFGSLFIWRAGKTTQGAGPNSLPLLPV